MLEAGNAQRRRRFHRAGGQAAIADALAAVAAQPQPDPASPPEVSAVRNSVHGIRGLTYQTVPGLGGREPQSTEPVDSPDSGPADGRAGRWSRTCAAISTVAGPATRAPRFGPGSDRRRRRRSGATPSGTIRASTPTRRRVAAEPPLPQARPAAGARVKHRQPRTGRAATTSTTVGRTPPLVGEALVGGSSGPARRRTGRTTPSA
jgi:hypothetical protein